MIFAARSGINISFPLRCRATSPLSEKVLPPSNGRSLSLHLSPLGKAPELCFCAPRSELLLLFLPVWLYRLAYVLNGYIRHEK